MDKEQRFEERVRLDEQQFKSLVKEIHDATTDNGKWLASLCAAVNGNTDAINNASDDSTKWQSLIQDALLSIDKSINGAAEDTLRQLATINDTIHDGLQLIATAITSTTTLPEPTLRGTIMASYAIPDDQPDGTFTLAVTATDSEGVPITDPAVLAALTVELINSDDTVFAATLGTDGRSGTYHVGAPGQSTVTQNLKAGDGTLLATGTDGFTVTTGAVALGSVAATFTGLTPVGP